MLNLRYFIVLILLIALTIYSEEIPDSSQETKYYIVNAKTGINLREKMDTESESLVKIPQGKILKLIEIREEKVNIKGNFSKWHYIEYKWFKGYVVGEFITDFKSLTEEEIKTLKKETLLGVWKGDWKCGKQYTQLKISPKEFKIWLFDGGDEGGCSGHQVQGTWKLVTENDSTQVCFTSKEEEACFYYLYNKLVWNPYFQVKNKKNYFTENFTSEFISGLSKEK